MDYKELYAQKLTTADEAAALVKSGDWVDYGWAVNTTVAVDAALAKRMSQLEGVNFRGGILMWVPAIFQIEDPAAHLTWNSWHMGGIERKAVAQGFSFYCPIRYSELPRYYRPPQGKYSEENLKQAQQLGYTTVFWSLAYVDWEQDHQPTAEAAFEKLLPHIHNGAVVLLHSTSTTNAAILDELLTKWEDMGYRFAPISALFEEPAA